MFLMLCMSNQIAAQGVYSYEGSIIVKTAVSVKDSLSEIAPFSGREMLLYRQYLIEPEIEIRLSNGTFSEIDTVGYYFIDLKDQIFSKYRTLSVKAKKVCEGELDSKDAGFKFYYETNDLFANVSNLTVRDTTIDNVRCKIATAIRTTPKGKYLLRGWIYPMPKLFPVQFSTYLARKAGNGFVKKMSMASIESGVNPKGAMVSEISFEARRLPKDIIQVIKTWGRGSR